MPGSCRYLLGCFVTSGAASRLNLLRGGVEVTVAGLADFPRDLVTLEEWDALELDEARHWELVEGGIVITPRPRPLHPSCRRISPGCSTNADRTRWSFCRRSRSRSRRASRPRCVTRTWLW